MASQQTVNGNLSKMAEIGAQYRYGGFTLKEVKLKNGNKEAWLYYDFQNEHVFVVDFGVPVRIMPSDINVAQSGWSGAKVDGKETSVGKYGTATVGVGKGLTYTATKPMQGVETFTVTLEFTDSDNKITGLTYLIYLVPRRRSTMSRTLRPTAMAGTRWARLQRTSISKPRRAARRVTTSAMIRIMRRTSSAQTVLWSTRPRGRKCSADLQGHWHGAVSPHAECERNI